MAVIADGNSDNGNDNGSANISSANYNGSGAGKSVM